MTEQPIIRDERTKSVGDASSRLGFNILCFGLLIDIIVRSAVFHEAPWDLFGLVIIGSWAAMIYQGLHKTFPPHFWRSVLVLGLISGLVSIIIVLVLAKFG